MAGTFTSKYTGEEIEELLEKEFRSITSIDTIYGSPDKLPAYAGNGTNYVALKNGKPTIYKYGDGWEEVAPLKSHTLYMVLTGTKAGLYRYTMASPYLLAVDTAYVDAKLEELKSKVIKPIQDNYVDKATLKTTLDALHLCYISDAVPTNDIGNDGDVCIVGA